MNVRSLRQGRSSRHARGPTSAEGPHFLPDFCSASLRKTSFDVFVLLVPRLFILDVFPLGEGIFGSFL